MAVHLTPQHAIGYVERGSLADDWLCWLKNEPIDSDHLGIVISLRSWEMPEEAAQN